MVKKGTDAVMTTNKYRSDERMGVARLVRPGEEAAVERDTLPRAGAAACTRRAAARLRDAARWRVSSFQNNTHYSFGLIYCGVFRITINLLSSEYSDASKGAPKDAISPRGNMLLRAHIMVRIGFPSST